MARSMIKLRHEAERLRIEAFEASLKRVRGSARPPPDFEKALKEARRGFETEIVRDAVSWHPQMKTRDGARLRLAAARHLFARYPVAAHLERIWLDTEGLADGEIRLRKCWYVVVARGGSLHKVATGRWLSRKETHWFLNPAGDLGFGEALWVAVARSYTDDIGLALRIGRSKIAHMHRDQIDFWREAVRFFCANPAPLEEIDDLCDYLEVAHRRDAGFSLKGRTLASLRRQMEEWHRDIAAIERIEAMRRRAVRRNGMRLDPPVGGAWPGSPLPDWDWQPSAKEAACRGERFVVRQLRTAEDLVAESRAMRHCVSSYANKCIAGNASIWALRRTALGKVERMLTIELDSAHRAVQVRGVANRLALPEERKILERWAKAKGVVL